MTWRREKEEERRQSSPKKKWKQWVRVKASRLSPIFAQVKNWRDLGKAEDNYDGASKDVDEAADQVKREFEEHKTL